MGSGLVERAVVVVINARMKKRGTRWKRANATGVVVLRVQQINAAWEAAAAWHPIVGGTVRQATDRNVYSSFPMSPSSSDELLAVPKICSFLQCFPPSGLPRYV